MTREHAFYRVSIKGLVTDDQGRILLLQESDGTRDLPGGGWDYDEDVVTGLTREFEEEMGVQIATIGKTPVYVWKADKQTHMRLMLAYQVEIAPGQQIDVHRSDECVGYQFRSPAEIVGGQMELNDVCKGLRESLSTQ